MTITAKENSIGAWAFLIGVILAILIGLGTSIGFISLQTLTKLSTPIYGILVILGLIVGSMLHVSTKDSQSFVLIGTCLVIVSRFGMESVNGTLIGIGIGDLITTTFGALLILFIPATIVFALKTVFNMAEI